VCMYVCVSMCLFKGRYMHIHMYSKGMCWRVSVKVHTCTHVCIILIHNILINNDLINNDLTHNVPIHNVSIHNLSIHNVLIHNVLIHNVLI